jgi:hypothetical protein
MATKTKKTKRRMPKCNCMMDMHHPELPTIAVLSLVTAATHAVRNGYDTDEDYVLTGAVNALLHQCHIECEFKDGQMTLTYDGDAYRKAKKSRR